MLGWGGYEKGQTWYEDSDMTEILSVRSGPVSICSGDYAQENLLVSFTPTYHYTILERVTFKSSSQVWTYIKILFILLIN